MSDLKYSDYQLEVVRELLVDYFANKVSDLDEKNLIEIFEVTHGEDYFDED